MTNYITVYLINQTLDEDFALCNSAGAGGGSGYASSGLDCAY
jgi:hypothetical protein